MQKTKLIYSSEVYEVDLQDLTALGKGENFNLPENNQEVVVLLGTKDCVISGQDFLLKAQKENKAKVMVRFASLPISKWYDFLAPFWRFRRNQLRFYGSNIYHVSPQYLRSLNIERSHKTKENAYNFTKKCRVMTLSERESEYNKIYNSIKNNGFAEDKPIDIMLLRVFGAKDCVDNGHHRLGIALDLHLQKIPVRFAVSPAAPFCLRRILKHVADLNLKIKCIRSEK